MDRSALVGRLLVAYQSRDFSEVERLVAPDVWIKPLAADLEPGPRYEGLEGVRIWFYERSPGRSFQPAVDSIETFGDRVLVVGKLYAALEQEELRAITAAWLFEFDDAGLMRSMQAFRDVDEARAAAQE